VSPLFGLNDQYAQLMRRSFRYWTSFDSHFLSDEDCSFVPNSPTNTGAMFFVTM